MNDDYFDDQDVCQVPWYLTIPFIGLWFLLGVIAGMGLTGFIING